MPETSVVTTTQLPNLLYRGKVRDTYRLSSDHLLMIATDRISAFDVVLPTAVPKKGLVLARLSAFWFRKTAHLIPNHFVALASEPEVPLELAPHPLLNTLSPQLASQATIARRAQRINVECVVRGYLAGSAWAEYSQHGTVFGQPLPPGLKEGDRLPEPLFTPTTKAEVGHDLPMSSEEVASLVGDEVAGQLQEASLQVYAFAHEYALQRGIVIADTKMEFGLVDGRLTLIDELLTPDSSRFWDLATYRPGHSLPNYDKQYVRDWLTGVGWSKEPPAPALPPEVVRQTTNRYVQVYGILTGQSLEHSPRRQLLPL